MAFARALEVDDRRRSVSKEGDGRKVLPFSKVVKI